MFGDAMFDRHEPEPDRLSSHARSRAWRRCCHRVRRRWHDTRRGRSNSSTRRVRAQSRRAVGDFVDRHRERKRREQRRTTPGRQGPNPPPSSTTIRHRTICRRSPLIASASSSPPSVEVDESRRCGLGDGRRLRGRHPRPASAESTTRYARPRPLTNARTDSGRPDRRDRPVRTTAMSTSARTATVSSAPERTGTTAHAPAGEEAIPPTDAIIEVVSRRAPAPYNAPRQPVHRAHHAGTDHQRIRHVPTSEFGQPENANHRHPGERAAAAPRRGSRASISPHDQLPHDRRVTRKESDRCRERPHATLLSSASGHSRQARSDDKHGQRRLAPPRSGARGASKRSTPSTPDPWRRRGHRSSTTGDVAQLHEIAAAWSA